MDTSDADHGLRAACLVASTEEDLADWVRAFTSAVQIAKQLRLADKTQIAAAQKGRYAAAMAALLPFQPKGSVFELPHEAGVLFPTVTEDVFLKMSVAERAKMSVRPLLIQGCSKLKWQLANIPQLQAVMHPSTSKFFHGAGRRITDTSMNRQPHRHTFAQTHQTHHQTHHQTPTNLSSNRADADPHIHHLPGI